MIPPELTHAFSHGARARGERYVAEGRIQLTSSDPLKLEGVARGSDTWHMTLEATSHRLQLRCTCPFAADNGFCKHLWGVLRIADQQGLLKPLVTAARGAFEDSSGDREDLYAEQLPLRKSRSPETTRADGDRVRRGTPPEARRVGNAANVPAWSLLLHNVKQQAHYEPPRAGAKEWPNDRRLIYIADIAASAAVEGLAIELATEKHNRDGTWGQAKLFRSGADMWTTIPDAIDREIGHMLRGTRKITEWTRSESTTGFVLLPSAFDPILRLMSETGRLRIRRAPHEHTNEATRWDSGPWRLRYRVERRRDGKVELSSVLERGGEEMPLHRMEFIHRAGFLVYDAMIAALDIEGPFALLTQIRNEGPISVSEHELPALIGALSDLPNAPRIELSEGLSVREVAITPVPILTLTRFAGNWRDQFLSALEFMYDGVSVSETRAGAVVFDARANRIIRRDIEAESLARALLYQLGVRRERDWRTSGMTLTIPPGRFEVVLRELVAAGWKVAIDGISHRTSTNVRASVRSGVDWFDLDVGVAFGDVEVPLPRVLEALRDKRSNIDLDDGGVGIITDEVKQRLTPLLAFLKGSEQLRFKQSQTALLDVLIAALPAVEVDKQFERARTELRTFERVEPMREPVTFCGELRPYQREGLGWFDFLRRFGLGGCLADDMGLGKTVQVLALLESRRAERAGPSLVVVPRSLVFNWKQEASRFAPELRVLDHTGSGRSRGALAPADENLIITTYGTLRQDITALREIEFDYVILDEAQAIKNSTTATAKAARLLRGRNRLALTGTPIENRIEELWSLFEFLNPGMLGNATAFKQFARLRTAGVNDEAREPNEKNDGSLLAQALRPVILRRTKEAVSPELPERIEQTLMVELESAQRRVYNELLAHYRQALLPYIERVGIARSKMKVLEALLRLRQAACHPALIDRSADNESESAKLDVLLPKLIESAAEGHKALVFSQFTSFLALLRTRLDAEEVKYAYLDGATRDRQAVVEQFQGDETCRVFLISLRAGGHGLNLTAADYVFLLDPWWNPAVEAQAIDRAHRIGQQRRVIATRLVARDTIEEKILDLQRTKRELADAILSEDQGVLAKIGREELELLLT